MACGTISEKCLVKIYACERCKEECRQEDARSLPCSHTLCLTCIGWATLMTQTGPTTPCPVCNVGFTLPAGGEQYLPAASARYVVTQQVEQLTVPAARYCDVCSGGEQSSVADNAKAVPTVYCVDCHMRMCTGCNMQHSVQQCRHTIVDLDEVPNADVLYARTKLISCDKHGNQRIVRYCIECQILICRLCSDGDHANHRFYYIEEAACPYRFSLKKMACVLGKVADVADDKLAGIDNDDYIFRAKVDLVRRQVQEQADRLTGKIEQERQMLLSELDDFESSRISRRKIAVNVIAQHKSHLKALAELSDKTSKTFFLDNMAEWDKQSTLNTKILLHWKLLGVLDVRFSASDLNFDGNGTDLGKVIKEEVADECLLKVPILAKVIDGVGGNGVLAMALLNNQLFVTRQNVAGLSVYDATTLQHQHDLTYPGFSNFLPGLAVRPNTECLYVSDFGNNCVHIVDFSTQQIGTVPSLTVNKPIGLSFSASGNLLVANHGSILECTLTAVVASSAYRLMSDSSGPYHVVALDSDRLVFSSANGSGLFVLTKNSKTMYTFCGNEWLPDSGSQQATNRLLRGLIVTGDGFVLVADHFNSRIIVVHPPTRKARHLPLDVDVDLQSPRALCYDESRGRLYIGEDGGQNRVLALDRVVSFAALFTK